MLDCEEQPLFISLSQDDKWRLPVEVSDVSPFFKDCLITYEDKRFYSHFGVDPLALGRAVWQRIKHGHVVSGGSTLTMQVAKLLDPSPRTWPHKLKEIFRAFQLEWRFSKEEILKLYLTLAPYGRNLEGIRAASLHYFGKEPFHLTPPQAALLVALPQNPSYLRPDLHPKAAQKQRNKVLSLYPQQTQALREEIALHHSPFPQQAYHFAQILKKTCRTNPCTSTLKATFQKKLEAILQTAVATLPSEQTAAAVIVDNHTHEIVAYVGSAFPHAFHKKGYVDIVRSIRSPGSTLKPFIYGLAFHEGWLKPFSIVKDQPYHFGNYHPTNFLDHFHGNVTVAEALQRSLNIPAVAALERLGPGHFLHWLQDVDVMLRTPKPGSPPSLAIALGGVGTRLIDLVSLYSALANDGLFYPLAWQKTVSKEAQTGRRLLSHKAAHMIGNILRASPPPDGYAPQGVGLYSSIAFKTGTSYGHRDALCLGYTERYTVGVWLGRADGTPVPAQVGRKHAAPLLFQIFAAIEPEALKGTPATPTTQRLLPSRHHDEEELLITFPFDESILLATTPIALTAQGGKPPYTWYIDDSPLVVSSTKMQMPWLNALPGFHEIMVIDSQGKTARTHVRLTAMS